MSSTGGFSSTRISAIGGDPKENNYIWTTEKIDQLIAARGRKNYQAAVPYAKTVKKLYTDILHKPDGWTQYISNLRQKNKTLRAFQEEFARL